MPRPDARFFAVAWSLVVGLLIYVPQLALAWAYKYRIRWALTGIFFLYVVAMIVLLVSLRR